MRIIATSIIAFNIVRSFYNKKIYQENAVHFEVALVFFLKMQYEIKWIEFRDYKMLGYVI